MSEKTWRAVLQDVTHEQSREMLLVVDGMSLLRVFFSPLNSTLLSSTPSLYRQTASLETSSTSATRREIDQRVQSNA